MCISYDCWLLLQHSYLAVKYVKICCKLLKTNSRSLKFLYFNNLWYNNFNNRSSTKKQMNNVILNNITEYNLSSKL